MAGPGPLFWLRLMEVHIINWLLRRPSFHRMVERVHKQYHRIRNGTPPEEMGGTNIDQPRNHGTLFRHFKDELQNQMKDFTGRRRPPKQ